jgi:ABC-type nitrate/sulfonate/bicarbonate transport system permease component
MRQRFHWVQEIGIHVVFIGLWELACRTVVPPMFLPAPSRIAVAFWQTLRSGELVVQLGQTASVLAVGFSLSIVTGMVVGIVMGTSRLAGRILDPYVNAMNATPTVALVPLVVIWLGLGYEAKVFLTWVVSFFSIVISSQAAVQNIPAAHLDTARAFACSRVDTLCKVIIPASVPLFVAGIRIGLGKALVGVVVAEMFTALSGLGYMVTNYGNTFKIDYVFVPILTLAALSILLTAVVRLCERRLMPWSRRGSIE